MNSKMFEDLNLSELIVRAVRNEGYVEPTDIQRAAIPEIVGTIAGEDTIFIAVRDHRAVIKKVWKLFGNTDDQN